MNPTRTSTRSMILTCVIAATPIPMTAQTGWDFTGGVSLEQVNVESAFPGGTERLRAGGFGLWGSLAHGRLLVDVRYKHANLAPSGSGLRRNMGEGDLTVGARVTQWLALSTGPHERRYHTSIGVQRWLSWNLRARGTWDFISERARGFVELSYALLGGVNLTDDWSSGVGSAVGITVNLPWHRTGLMMVYRLDHLEVGNDTRSETVDGLSFALTLGPF